MFIERLQVEEGFLDGLDIRFSPGLNTLIGARGTGKTSVIELIRFCLGAPSFTSETSKRSLEHATAVLGRGKVTVTLKDNEAEILVTRSGDDAERFASAAVDPPIIMSQTEVESIGLQASGRLQLIDSFIQDKTKVQASEVSCVGSIKSITAEIEILSREIKALDDKIALLPQIEASILSIEEKEKAISTFSESAALKQKSLDVLSAQISTLSVRDSYIARFEAHASELVTEVYKGIKNGAQVEDWPFKDSPDPLADTKARYFEAVNTIVKAYNEIHKMATHESAGRVALAGERSMLESQARELRKEIEVIMEGAGAITREGARLRESRAQLLGLKALKDAKLARDAELVAQRKVRLDNLDEIRNSRYELRRAVCDSINRNLGPRIRIDVDRAAQIENYTRLLSDSLKGSGIRYGDLSKSITQMISPRELTNLVESGDYEQIAEIANISADRAIRVIAQLKDAGLGEISTCLVEDDIRFMLLDGSEFKDIISLSTGQRCTVILPIVLEHEDKIVIVDQPEDHIDNAFIADTLIKSLSNRAASAQLIFTTHNANIPVLGNADKVIQMASDGRRGYVRLADSLEHPTVVDAISNVMEGGRFAFAKRAEFYQGPGLSDVNEP